MAQTVNNIAIIGGGTAGWLTAARLASQLGCGRPGGVSIQLIESPLVPTIGVGEGTLPSLRLTLAKIGIDEAEFMRECDATFKQGIEFANWMRGSRSGHAYFHPFNSPRALGGVELAPYWALNRAKLGNNYADAVTPQVSIYSAGRAPKRLTDASFSGPMNYAYHLDIGRFATYMQKVSERLGVIHTLDHIEHVNLDQRGFIGSLQSAKSGTIEADLFIDCTGFSAKLIGEAMGSELTPIADTLFCDRAVAMPVSYDDPEAPIRCGTLSTAHEAGWTWDIALSQRRGVGYVYSSAHSTTEQAETILRSYVGPQADAAEPRHLKMQTGYRKTQWLGNCVAVGLSGGFLEPLESTGILMVEAAAELIADYFPRHGDFAAVANTFNRAMTERFENAIDFIKMHFYLSDRRDSEFWIDNTKAESAPSSLLEKLELWRYRLPNQFDLSSVHESFRHINYEYILLGMNAAPDLVANASAFPHTDAALREFQMIEQATQRALAALPDHRQLINSVQIGGFGQKTAARASR